MLLSANELNPVLRPLSHKTGWGRADLISDDGRVVQYHYKTLSDDWINVGTYIFD